MRIWSSLLGVIFVLSTIVLVTDCCSSRILLVKDRPDREQIPTQIDHSNELLPPEKRNQSDAVEFVNIDADVLNKTEKSLIDPGSENSDAPLHAAEFITNPTIRATKAGNPNYHVIDIYYTIMRDVLSFECTGQFLTDFCLNKGRCFRYPIGNHSFFSCECADGYVGERCESKSLNEFIIPTTSSKTLDNSSPQILTARIVFSFPMLIAISSIYLMIAATIVFRCPRKDCISFPACVCRKFAESSY